MKYFGLKQSLMASPYETWRSSPKNLECAAVIDVNASRKRIAPGLL